MKLIDTTVAIDYLRRMKPAVNLILNILESEEGLWASELVRFELTAGVRPKEFNQMKDFFSLISWVAE